MKRLAALLFVLLVVSGAVHLWQARTAWLLRVRIAQLELVSEQREARVHALVERAKALRDAPPPPAPIVSAVADRFIPESIPSVTTSEGRLDPRAVSELRRDEVRQVLLNGVLDVVAETAADEGWDPEVAADVMAVFEATAGRMGEVRAMVIDGQLTPTEGRAQVLALRDDAGLRLDRILGEADTDRLRDRMFDRVQASVEERKRRKE